jgi:MFS superfamily sulfate permease-like transporter
VTTAAVVIPQAMAYAIFISAPVLAGFKAGVGLLIAAGQLGKVLGVPRRATASSPLAGGFFQAFPAGGGLSQTAVNRETGARSQLAAIVTALVVVLTLLSLTPLFEDLPQATLGRW